MFPSRNSINPFEFSFKTDFLCHQNPTSKQDDDDDDQPPHDFLAAGFPCPFDESELPLNQMLLQNKHAGRNGGLLTDLVEFTPVSAAKETVKSSTVEPSEISGSPAARARTISGKGQGRRRGRKDRHSKIRTAQGERDRRMRLSLQIARKFFDLQDLLGFDKASKTVEWLFAKSKNAIKELTKEHPQTKKTHATTKEKAESSSFVSECDDEVVSGINYKEIESTDEMTLKSIAVSRKASLLGNKEKGQRKRRLRKTVNRPDMRKSREEARARAKSRTREKMINKMVEIFDHQHKANPNPINTPFEIGEVAKSHVENEQMLDIWQHLGQDVGTIERLLGLSSCPISDSCNKSSGLSEHWDLLNRYETSCTDQYMAANTRADATEGNPNSIFLVSDQNLTFGQ